MAALTRARAVGAVVFGTAKRLCPRRSSWENECSRNVSISGVWGMHPTSRTAGENRRRRRLTFSGMAMTAGWCFVGSGVPRKPLGSAISRATRL